jgi:hypothetical protein
MSLDVNGGLRVEGEDVGAGTSEVGQVVLRIFNHEMHIDRMVCQTAECPDDGSTKGQVRDEVPVHDVHVEPLGSAGDGAFDLLS